MFFSPPFVPYGPSSGHKSGRSFVRVVEKSTRRRTPPPIPLSSSYPSLPPWTVTTVFFVCLTWKPFFFQVSGWWAYFARVQAPLARGRQRPPRPGRFACRHHHQHMMVFIGDGGLTSLAGRPYTKTGILNPKEALTRPSRQISYGRGLTP